MFLHAEPMRFFIAFEGFISEIKSNTHFNVMPRYVDLGQGNYQLLHKREFSPEPFRIWLGYC